jgi:hypothetical protein
MKREVFTKPNPYDMLWPNNIRDIMGPYLILWPLPMYSPEMRGQGLYYPEYQVLKPTEQGILMRDNNAFFKREKKELFNPYKEFAGDT